MPLSTEFTRAVLAANSNVIPLLLMTLSHPDMPDPGRLVLNTQDAFSRGNRYMASNFRTPLPVSSGAELARSQLEVDNVDRRIVATLRALQEEPTITVELVSSITPDVVEMGPFEFKMISAKYDTLVVRGTLAYEDILNQPFPAGTYNPRAFPRLFK